MDLSVALEERAKRQLRHDLNVNIYVRWAPGSAYKIYIRSSFPLALGVPKDALITGVRRE